MSLPAAPLNGSVAIESDYYQHKEVDEVNRLGSAIGARLGFNSVNAVGSIVAVVVTVMVAAGVTLGAMAVSNTLTLGPSQVGLAVMLTKVEDLPSSIAIGEENEVRFKIESDHEVDNATLMFELRAQGANLTAPSLVDVRYRHPDDDFESVSLTSSGGNLRGTLKSGWDVPDDYDETARIEIIFNSGAPTASYSIDLWIEGDIGSGSSTGDQQGDQQDNNQQSQARSFTLGADGDGWEGVSGDNSGGGSIASTTNPTLIIKAGETTELNIVRRDSTHNIAVYTQTCNDGWCDNPVARSANVKSSSPDASISFSFPTAGTTLSYYCDFHPDDMRGTINVVQ